MRALLGSRSWLPRLSAISIRSPDYAAGHFLVHPASALTLDAATESPLEALGGPLAMPTAVPVTLSEIETLIIALIALFAGKAARAGVPWLRRIDIPDAVIGGLATSAVALAQTAPDAGREDIGTVRANGGGDGSDAAAASPEVPQTAAQFAPSAPSLKQVEPTSKAKYVAFESYYDTKQMPLGRQAGIQLPYVEGLRLDEAMHPLALLSVGMYGETLPNQNGAPVRLVLPWKYGFKSIKSLVKIKLTTGMPRSTWNIANSREYGFYSNVNPSVDHPRWTQKTERRLGELGRRQTLMFNGYGDQVASMYSGMDLKVNY